MSYWYGLSFEDISNMPIAAIEAYLKQLDARQAETRLILADAASLPYMKKADQARTINKWVKTANAQGSKQSRQPASPAILRLMGIGVEVIHVDSQQPG